MIKHPTPATLKKYGLTLIEWLEILNRQGSVCAVCHKEPTSGRLNIDHEHVKGWKKMLPEERKKHVRGLACYICNNRILTKGITPEKLESAAKYLRNYEENKYGTTTL